MAEYAAHSVSLYEDKIENIIGQFGKYQYWRLLLISLARLPTDFQLTNVVFLLPKLEYVCLDAVAENRTNYCPCESPKYKQINVVNSVASEWNLICGRTTLASLTQSMLQIGVLPGSLLFGYISDRCGRKAAVILALFFCPFFVTISAIAPCLWLFMASRFFIGAAVGGTMLCTYVLFIEISGKSFRPYLMGLLEIAHLVGYLLIPIVAHFVREWRQLQLWTSIPPWFLIILCYFYAPESPRWLITTGNTKEAVVVLKRIVKFNNRQVQNIEGIVDEIEKSLKSEEQKASHGSYLDLFKTPGIRMYTIFNALVWMCCAHTFFGVNQYIGVLPGNIYVNVSLSAIFHFPGLLLIVIGAVYLNRKLCTLIGFLVAGFSLFALIFVPSTYIWISLVFAITGLTGVYASFVIIYLYSTEIFPTVVRNSAMAFASVFARAGSFVAPFVVNIGVEWVSITIFMLSAFCAAILCCFLPETKDIVLLNTVAETEQMRQNSKQKIPKSNQSIN